MTGGASGAGPGVRLGWQWDVALSFVGAQRDYAEWRAGWETAGPLG